MSVAATGALEMQIDGSPARDVTPFLRQFIWRDSMIHGGWYCEINFSTEVWGEWEDVLLGRDSSDIRVRMKQQGGVVEATEWRSLYVNNSRTAFRGTAMAGRVFGGDIRLAMQTRTRKATWKDTTASQIFSAIAERWDLTPSIADTVGKRTWWQLEEDDWSFSRRLAENSATKAGRGDAYLWVDGANLRYDAPNTSDVSTRRYDLRMLENRVDRLLISFNGRDVDRAGGTTLQRIGYDFSQKAAIPFVVDQAAASAFPALAQRVPRIMTNGLRVYPTFEETMPLVEESARAHWGRTAQRYYAAQIDTRGDLTLKPGVVIEVLNNLSTEAEAPFFGRYGVLEVTHTMLDGVVSTSMLCHRREAGIGDEDTSGASTTTSTKDNYVVDKQQTAQVMRQVQVIA